VGGGGIFCQVFVGEGRRLCPLMGVMRLQRSCACSLAAAHTETGMAVRLTPPPLLAWRWFSPRHSTVCLPHCSCMKCMHNVLLVLTYTRPAFVLLLRSGPCAWCPTPSAVPPTCW
jgi:hypothetical protein